MICSLLVIPFTIAGICTPPPSDIIAWWPFDETSGSIANDIIGNRDGAYINSPQQVQGLVGNALRFNGQSSYVGVVDDDLWAFNLLNFTVEVWANFNSPGRGSVSHPGDTFVGNDEGPNNVRKWWFSYGGSQLNFHINSPTLTAQFFPLVSFTPPANTWQHVAVTREGNLYTIYINGIASGTAINANAVPNANAPLTIGQAEGLGYFFGQLDELSIYHKALSAQELQAIVAAGPDGKCKEIRITTSSLLALQQNQFSSFQFQAELGTSPYSWSLVNGNLPTGMNFYSDGVLNGTPTQAGNFPFRVRVTDSQSNSAEKNINLEVAINLPPPNVRIYKTGTTAVPGRDIDYFIVVENAGTTVQQNVQIDEFIEPWFTLLFTDPTSLNITNLTDVYPYSSTPPEYEGYIRWNLGTFNPNEAKIVHYRVNLDATFPVNEEVHGPNCLTIPEADLCLNLLYICLVGVPIVCAPTLNPPICALTNVLRCETAWAGCMLIAGSNDGPTTQGFCAIHNQPTRASLDPNEKEVIANKFIQSGHRLPYVIHYENIGTADAQDIFVTDNLDPKYDLSTVEVFVNNTFMPITNGQSIILFQQNQTTTINQTIGNQTFEFNISYFENHTVSLMNNRLRWELLNVRLPPNATDSVLMAVKPNVGLINGTQIKNDAEIVFDINQPIITNETLNIIDDVKPQCIVNSLPVESYNQNISLSWIGTDTLGEIDTYTIFMSKNGGALTSVISNTKDLNASIETSGSGKYDFICIATDTAGNIEVQPPTSEATTHVNLVTLQMSGTPRVGQTITFTLSDPSQPNTPYIFAVAGSALPGIPLGDGRVIPLMDDIIFRLSLVAPQTFGMVNSFGTLNSNGQAIVTINIPNQSFLANIHVVVAYVTLDLNRPLPDFITAVSPEVPITILP
ncbi:MAG: LamG-like jellyroll fold domain-containing protein [Candidatus Woesearchaeota archaeon]|nr:LamG-like jellyroll fold domain-containing protein [Candidatus Woesearchaeota archaeon]